MRRETNRPNSIARGVLARPTATEPRSTQVEDAWKVRIRPKERVMTSAEREPARPPMVKMETTKPK